MLPGRLPRDVFPVGERHVQAVEAREELVRPPDLGKDFQDVGLQARVPDELLVRDSVRGEGVDLALDGQVLLDPRRRVVKVELGAEGLEPLVGLLLIAHGTFSGNRVLDNGESVLVKIALPISGLTLAG